MLSTMYPVLLADWGTDLVRGLDPGQRFVLLVVAIGCGTGLVLGALGMVTGALSSVHRRRLEMELKREMLDRGLSADEIAKVIESASPPEDATDRWIASWADKKESAKTG